MQTEALFPTSGEKRPGAQDLHSEAQPGDGLCRPGWHARHAASMELLMMLRLSSLLDPAPTAVRPAGQSRHTLLEFAPCCVANLPAGQSWHASSERSGPESSENFPAGHDRHVVLPVEVKVTNVPGTHCSTQYMLAPYLTTFASTHLRSCASPPCTRNTSSIALNPWKYLLTGAQMGRCKSRQVRGQHVLRGTVFSRHICILHFNWQHYMPIMSSRKIFGRARLPSM